METSKYIETLCGPDDGCGECDFKRKERASRQARARQYKPKTERRTMPKRYSVEALIQRADELLAKADAEQDLWVARQQEYHDALVTEVGDNLSTALERNKVRTWGDLVMIIRDRVEDSAETSARDQSKKIADLERTIRDLKMLADDAIELGSYDDDRSNMRLRELLGLGI